MPTYDYICQECGAEIEIVHRMGIKKHKCPECGAVKGLERSWLKVAAYHSRFSPMHPRKGRGEGNSGNATEAIRKKAKDELDKKIKKVREQKGASSE